MNLSFDGKGINGPDEFKSRIATFSSDKAAVEFGPLFATAPDLLEQLNAFVEFANEWFTDGMPEDWKGRCVCANVVIDKATSQG